MSDEKTMDKQWPSLFTCPTTQEVLDHHVLGDDLGNPVMSNLDALRRSCEGCQDCDMKDECAAPVEYVPAQIVAELESTNLKQREQIADLSFGYCAQHGGKAGDRRTHTTMQCPRCLKERVAELEGAITKTVDCDPIRPLNDDCKDCGHVLLCSALGTVEQLSAEKPAADKTGLETKASSEVGPDGSFGLFPPTTTGGEL